MSISPIEIWLIVGVVFIVIEFSTIPGIGFLFLGLGGLTTSILIYFFQDLLDYQIATAGISSLIWFLLLWWPLKKFVYGKDSLSKRDYFDLVGSQVIVVDGQIALGSLGRVSWSGTTMNARLSPEEDVTAEIGDLLYISEINGNIVICSRKKPH